MTARWLEEAVEACGLTASATFPRNLAAEVPLKLRVTVVPLPRLTSTSVSEWLARRKMHHRVVDLPRGLHGCMVAWAGVGVLFHDSTDSPAQQRFTVAHEVAHFVLDHWLPRLRALRAFGESILPVLDGLRPPTPEESLSALFERVHLGLQVKLMDRNASGLIRTGRAAESERRADRLALELLAPSALVIPLLRDATRDEAVSRVVFKFGLPREEARTYVEQLLRRQRAPRFSLQRLFGEDGR
ncbi:ImmA/IrrE family metallo-endopeptidase [Pyxidicoccus sp. 3LG]